MLAGYGTGAIMAVPAHDSRDWAFARHFGLEIVPVVEGGDIEKESYDAKSGKLINSDFLDGMDVKEAIRVMFAEVERRGLGKKLVNYRLRDAIFSRQRYWGEPFPIYYKDDTAYPLSEDKLPLELPPDREFRPHGRRANRRWPASKGWATPEGYPYELLDDARIRRLVGLLPPLHGPAQRQGARRAAKPTSTGATWTSTWAASSTPRDT